MSRHFVTVCVVCALSAAHAPCCAHTEVQPVETLLQNSRWNFTDSGKLDDGLDPLKNQIGLEESYKLEDTGEQLRREIERYENDAGRGRPKKQRNVDIDESFSTKKILQTYGNGKNMSLKGFERLLKKLGLLELTYNLKDTRDGNNNTRLNQTNDDDIKKVKQGCISNEELVTKLSQDALYWSETDNSTMLPGWLVERMWPTLIYQLASEDGSQCFQIRAESEPAKSGLTKSRSERSEPVKSESSVFTEKLSYDKPKTWEVWIYSSVSVAIISLCGMLGVVIMPVMNKAYYHVLLQFLVALAIGTLCGDALIHLIPHAMSGAHGHSHAHGHTHEPGHTHAHGHTHAPAAEVGHTHAPAAEVGQNHTYGTNFEDEYDYSDDNDNHTYGRDYSDEYDYSENEHAHSHAAGHEHGSDHDLNMWKGLVVVVGLIVFFFMEKGLVVIGEWRMAHQQHKVPNHSVKISRDGNAETQDNERYRQYNDNQREANMQEALPLTTSTNAALKKNNDHADLVTDEAKSCAVIIREHEVKHHGHLHTHHHVHSAPETIANVAWMVIIGDGLHNFTDGIAIGAAFAVSIPGGFSTAIAVFCHELPQELGDFAVLLKAGMTVKKAVFYNMLSAMTCFLGMIMGIFLGDLPSATGWIFAASAGTFIYIGLVDMVPELASSNSSEPGSKWYSSLHALGMITGAGLMLIIGLYEHDLYNIIQ